MCEGASSCAHYHTVRKTNYSHENSLDLGDSLKGSWRPTRGWPANTLRTAVRERHLFEDLQGCEKEERKKQRACIKLEQSKKCLPLSE